MIYYAVRKGTIEGIFQNLDDFKKAIEGFSEPEFASFSTYEEAANYLGIKETKTDKIVTCYIDGSFSLELQGYSFGGVLLIDDKEVTFQRAFFDEYLEYRNVAGEVRGAAFIINYCYKHNYTEINLYYDYMGIEKWFTGEWKANNNLTKSYVEFANSVKDKIKVNFFKVKSHTGNKYNEMADKLAKSALNM